MAAALIALPTTLLAQQPPYDVFPPADPPYYRVRYEASTQPGELAYPVNYTIWIPKDAKTLRGVIVHQHGCGEGSCKSGLTGAYDLHWQAPAKKHHCALLAPSYEQPDKAECQLWCDPRNGSSDTFQKCLVDLGAKLGHPELAKVPWALWGHSVFFSLQPVLFRSSWGISAFDRAERFWQGHQSGARVSRDSAHALHCWISLVGGENLLFA